MPRMTKTVTWTGSLDAYSVEAPSAALQGRILASAAMGRTRRSWFALGPLWLSGAGLAAACAFGILVGVDLGGASARAGLTDPGDGERLRRR